MKKYKIMSKVHCINCGHKEADEGDNCLKCAGRMVSDCCNENVKYVDHRFICEKCNKDLYPNSK